MKARPDEKTNTASKIDHIEARHVYTEGVRGVEGGVYEKGELARGSDGDSGGMVEEL